MSNDLKAPRARQKRDHASGDQWVDDELGLRKSCRCSDDRSMSFGCGAYPIDSMSLFSSPVAMSRSSRSIALRCAPVPRLLVRHHAVLSVLG